MPKPFYGQAIANGISITAILVLLVAVSAYWIYGPKKLFGGDKIPNFPGSPKRVSPIWERLVRSSEHQLDFFNRGRTTAAAARITAFSQLRDFATTTLLNSHLLCDQQ